MELQNPYTSNFHLHSVWRVMACVVNEMYIFWKYIPNPTTGWIYGTQNPRGGLLRALKGPFRIINFKSINSVLRFPIIFSYSNRMWKTLKNFILWRKNPNWFIFESYRAAQSCGTIIFIKSDSDTCLGANTMVPTSECLRGSLRLINQPICIFSSQDEIL